ncbi:hypothetical protein BpHYR1_034426 [Brachionus plicatilis]|uniref:Uncharacterized protein n=1 Tax=Brachionus plicatilis TaxID=10195 RepID=A0A3M7TAF5_BRAPC|nr:hypothetical protein BpHYR1_034426 [Brachionus plicatilis]
MTFKVSKSYFDLLKKRLHFKAQTAEFVNHLYFQMRFKNFKLNGENRVKSDPEIQNRFINLNTN